jgi:hypothetical protein
MKYSIAIIFFGLVFGCAPKTKENSAGSNSTGTAQDSTDTATVVGTVEREDTDLFVNEIDVEDWSTLEAQNTAGTNLLLTKEVTTAGVENVAIYKLGKDANGNHDFFPEASVELSSDDTFTLKVKAYTYYVVKYKTLTGFVPALAKDTTLPLVLNAESSVAVNLFIRMVQTDDGKALVDAKNIDSKVIESIAKKISSPGITDYKTVIDAVLAPLLSQQADPNNNISKSDDEVATIVQKIINVATTSDTLTAETKIILKKSTTDVPKNAAVSIGFTDVDLQGGVISGIVKITAATVEDFSHYVVYWGKSPTVKLNDTPIVSIPVNGQSHTVTISEGTLVPEGATHLQVFTKNVNGEMAAGVSVAIIDLGVPIYAPVSMSFTDTDTDGGQIGGNVIITKAADETDITHYVLYWGSNSTTKQSGIPIVEIAKTGANLTHSFSANTVIPISPNATHILAFTKNTDGEMGSGQFVAIGDLGVPVNAAASVAFTDTDLDGSQLGGTVTITNAANEADLTHYVLYWGSNSTTKQSGTKIAEIAKTGANITFDFVTNTTIPTGPAATHLLVFTKNAGGEMASGVSVAITDLGVPVNAAVSVAFTDTDVDGGQVGGSVTITKAGNETDISHYVLYWGSNSTTKKNQTPIANIAKTGANVTHNFAANTSIPTGPAATHLLVFTKNNDGEMGTGVNIAITDIGVPTEAAGGISFTDGDTTAGEISGTVTIAEAQSEADLTHYVLYWGTNSTTKRSGSPIATIAKTGADVTHSFSANTSIPTSPLATHLLVFTRNDDGEMATGVSRTISDNDGSTGHRVFVSSLLYNGNMGGLSGANTICANLAAAVPLTGTWKAILSDASTDANTNISINGEVRNMNNDVVAANSSDFWTLSNWNQPIDYDENSSLVGGAIVWTGSTSIGAKNGTDQCTSWSSPALGMGGYTGLSNATGPTRIERDFRICSTMRRIYCINGQ